MSNVSWYDGCCSEEVVVFVSFVSPTTTACVSFVGAVGGDGGGAASSVVLHSIVTESNSGLSLLGGLSRYPLLEILTKKLLS